MFKQELAPQLSNKESIQGVYYYGAGCSHADNRAKLSKAIKEVIPNAEEVFVGTDLLGTARGLCGHSRGMACIIGTGSSACLFDGEKVLLTREGLGFAMGDEGGGAYLGKILLRDYLFNRMSKDMKAKFVDSFGPISRDEVLTNVYKKESPNQYCAKFATFCSANIEQEYIKNLVRSSLAEFVNISLEGLVDEQKKKETPVNFSGSIAVVFKDILGEVLQEHGFQMGIVLQDPAEGITKYHCEQ